MSTRAITILAIIFGAIALISVTVLATLGIAHTEKPAPVVAENTTPPPAPVVEPPAPTDMAQIIAIDPHMISVSTPYKKCERVPHTFYQQQPEAVPLAGAAIGGVAGGLAGSLVHGNGREVAIGAGAAIGALTGKNVQNNLNQPVPVTNYTLHCSTHYTSKKEQKGYEVTYIYNSQQSKILMKSPPVGSSVPVSTLLASSSSNLS